MIEVNEIYYLDGGSYTPLKKRSFAYIWDKNDMVNVTPVRDSGTLGADPFTIIKQSDGRESTVRIIE